MTADSLVDPESAAKIGHRRRRRHRRGVPARLAALGRGGRRPQPAVVRPRLRAGTRVPRHHLPAAVPAVRRPRSGALGDLRPDGSSGAVSGSLAFPRAPRRMAGGENTTFHLPAYHRDEIEMVRTIESIVEKEGRSGRFVLVTWRSEYRNQHRELVAEATTSMIAGREEPAMTDASCTTRTSTPATRSRR